MTTFRHYLVAMALMFVSMPIYAQTYKFADVANQGATWTFTLNGTNATLTDLDLSTCNTTFSGTMVIPAYATDDQTVPNKYQVTAIGDGSNPPAWVKNAAITGVDFTSAVNLTTINQGFFDAGGNAANGNRGYLKGGLDLTKTKLTVIGGNAFHNQFDLTGQLIIPNTVTTITAFGQQAGVFRNTGFTSLTFAEGSKLDRIGWGAFSNMYKLSGDIVLPESLTTIGAAAFSGDSLIRSVTFKSSSIDFINSSNLPSPGVFNSCNHLEYIDMKSVTTIIGLTSLRRYGNSQPVIGQPFYGLPQHTLVYLTSQTALSTAGGGLWDSNVSHADIPNYIVNQECYSLNIENGVDYFFPYIFGSHQVMYTPNSHNSTALPTKQFEFSAVNTYSIYLPYAFNLPTSMGGYSISYYNGHNTGDEDNTFVFKKTATFQANFPYIARIEDSSTTMTTLPVIGTPVSTSPLTTILPSPTGVNHSTSPAGALYLVGDALTATGMPSVKDTNGVTWTLYGTTEKIDAATAKAWGAYYFATNNTWYPVSGSAGEGYSYPLNQMRVFLVPDTPGAAPSAKLFGGYADENDNSINVERLINNGSGQVEHKIYTIDGKYVGTNFYALPKGVYIVNGIKTIKD